MKRPALIPILCLVAGVAACGGSADSHPGSLPRIRATPPAYATPPSSVAATPSATAGAVPKPAGADEATSEGAEAFVKYYFAVLSQAIKTNDTTTLRRLSAPECEGCQRYIDSIEREAKENKRVETDGLLLASAVAPSLENNETVVLADFDAAPFVIRNRDGSEYSRNDGLANLTGELRCVREAEGWIIMGFRLATGK